MILLRLVSWPYFRKHLLRTLLTTAGIALGVGVFVAMHAANASVLASFSQTVDQIAGKAQLQVTAGETGFGEDILEKVQSAASVSVAVPVIEVIAESNLKGEGSLLVLGIDMTGDRSLRDYDFDGGDSDLVDDPLLFLAQPDSLILSKEFADRNHITIGGHLVLGTADGPKTFTVRGITTTKGLASAFGGNLAVMDIYAAQKMFGRGRTFDRIDLAIAEGATLAECTKELQDLLGPGFDVQPPSGRGQQFEAMLGSYSVMVSISSVFALFIGLFIIYNSFSIAVAERRTEIGTLRALGASQRQIGGLFIGESAVIGLIGSAVGLAFGLFIARGLAAGIGGLIADVYRIEQRPEALAISTTLIAAGVLAGVATSVVAAVIPARSAARVDPVRAMQKGQAQLLSAAESGVRVAIAAGCGLLAGICIFWFQSRPLFYAGYILAVCTAVLLGPVLTLALSRAIRPLLRWILGVEGTLAADSLARAPRRTSASVAALMLSLALAVAFEGMSRANRDSIVDWADSTLNSDLFVMPSQSLDVRASRFPATMAPEIAAVPGVGRVQMLRNARIMFRDKPVMVLAMEMRSIAETVTRRPVAGNSDEMYSRSADGQGILVSDNLAQLQNLHYGEVVEIAAPYGTIRLPIVGIIVDYSDQQGSILMDRTVFAKYWHDDSVNMFRVYVAPDADVAAVRQRIAERYDGKRQVFVLTNTELKSYILRLVNQWFGLTSIQIAVAVLVAILGVVNTLTVSITDRRKEFGVLRAVGAFQRQVRHIIWIEAVTVGAFGLILGTALGAVNLYYILEIVHRDINGMYLDYTFPTLTVLALVPTILAAAFLASLWPAEMAFRGTLVEALEYE
jgi:putative ABC transport system permease protein